MKYLVLDLDNTIIFNNTKKKNNKKIYKIQPRPHLFNFLSQLKKYYKLVIFTAGNRNYCDYVLNKIDKKRKYFKLKFSGEDLKKKKNLKLICKDLSKIIHVDDKDIYFSHKKNGIKIPRFFGDKNDNVLKILKYALIEISQYDDLRKGVKEINKLINFK